LKQQERRRMVSKKCVAEANEHVYDMDRCGSKIRFRVDAIVQSHSNERHLWAREHLCAATTHPARERR
jgi:hypothetical protein